MAVGERAAAGGLLPGVGGRVKVVVVGDHKVGKTSLVQHIFASDPMVGGTAPHAPGHSSSTLILSAAALAAGSGEVQEGPAPTVGIDFARRPVDLSGEEARHVAGCVRLHVFDTSGQQRFQSLADSYLQELEDHDAVVLVYDVTRRDTWKQAASYATRARSLGKGAPQIAVVAAKADAGAELREVTADEGRHLAENLSAVIFAEVGQTPVGGADADGAGQAMGGVLRSPAAVEEWFLRPLLRVCCEAAEPSVACPGAVRRVGPAACGCEAEEERPPRCAPWFRCLGLV